MALVQGRLQGRAINGTITSRQRADVAVRLCPWGRDSVQMPAVSLRIAGGWLPSDASPIGWWRADIERTAVFWGDISGNGMNGTQINGSDWESTSSTAINGQECARFQATAGAFGAYDFLGVYTAGQIANTDGVTLVCVYQLSTGLPTNSYVTPLTIAEGATGRYAGLRITNESGFKSTSFVAWTYGSDASVGYGSAPDTNGHAVIAYGDAVDVDNPTSYDATDNGTTQTIAASAAYTAPAVGLGYLDTGLLSSCTQVLDVAEAIVFRGALSASDATELDAYLLARYGLAGSTAYTANVSESLTIAEAIAVLAGFVPGVAETATIGETVTSAAGFVIGPAETLTLGEVLDALAAYTTALSESATLAESVDAVAAYVDQVTEALSVAEALSVTLEAVIGVAEATALAEALSAAYDATVAAAETVGVSEALDTVAAYASSLVESLTAAEALDAGLQFPVGLSEALTLAESLSEVLAAAAGLSETLTLAEAVEVAAAAQAALSETLAVVEALQAQLGAVVGLDAGATLAEALSLVEALLAVRLSPHVGPRAVLGTSRSGATVGTSGAVASTSSSASSVELGSAGATAIVTTSHAGAEIA